MTSSAIKKMVIQGSIVPIDEIHKDNNCLPFPKNSGNTGRKTSSEAQGQIVGARESLNGRENMAGRKVKNGEKSPWGQCLTRPVPNGRRRSAF